MSKLPLKRPPTSGTRRGNGAGWGGAASGNDASGNKAVPFEAGNQAAVGHGGHDLSKAKRIARLQDNLEHLALHAEAESVRMQASNHLLNRLDGMPIARNINVNADEFSNLDDAALNDRIAAAERALREADRAQGSTAGGSISTH